MTELGVRLLLALLGLVLLLPATAAARASRCNLRRTREAFSHPPLARLTPAVLAAQTPRGLPARWPYPATLNSEMRAAYGRLARDRADSRTLIGELVLIVAGAAAGASITSAVSNPRATWGLTLALLLGIVGVLLWTLSVQRWLEVAEDYER